MEQADADVRFIIDQNVSDQEYVETQVYSPSSLGPINIMNKDYSSPGSHFKATQFEKLTDDLRRSIDRLDKVIDNGHVNYSLMGKATSSFISSSK